VMRGTITSFAAVIVVKAFGLLESIAVARILGDVQYGLLALVLSATNLVLACGTLGLPAALTKFLSGEASSSREAAWGTIRRAVRTVLVTSAAAGLVFGIVMFQLLPDYPEGSLKPLVVLGTILVAACAPLVLFGNALQGLGRITELNLRAGLAAVAGLALAIPLCLFLGTLGAIIAFVFGVAFVGATAIPTVWKIARSLPSSTRPDAVSVRSLLNYGLPTLLSGLTVLSAFYWINSRLALGRGFGDLGDFAVAFTLANVITLLSGSVGVPLVPLLSSLSVADPQRGQVVVARVMRMTMFLSAPFVLGGICFSREIIGLTYGPQFTSGSTFLSILALSSFLASISGIVGNQIGGAGKMWLGLAINLVWTSTVDLASFLLIPAYGGVGASASILTGYAALCLVAVMVGRSMLQVPISGLRVPAVWATLLLTSALVAAFFGGVWRIPAGLLVVGAALVSMIWLLSPSERSIIRDVLSMLEFRGKTGGGV